MNTWIYDTAKEADKLAGFHEECIENKTIQKYEIRDYLLDKNCSEPCIATEMKNYCDKNGDCKFPNSFYECVEYNGKIVCGKDCYEKCTDKVPPYLHFYNDTSCIKVALVKNLE